MNNVEEYPTDMTDEQWEILAPYIPKAKSGQGKPGRPTIDVRQAINGIFYLNKTGCQWRMLPKKFGNWNTVYCYLKRWRTTNTWFDIMDILNKKERLKKKKNYPVSRLC